MLMCAGVAVVRALTTPSTHTSVLAWMTVGFGVVAGVLFFRLAARGSRNDRR